MPVKSTVTGKTGISVVGVVLFAIVSGSASAGGNPADATAAPACYQFDDKFVDDHGLDANLEPVCKAILAELNSQCDQGPHVCGLPQVSGRTGISLPKWEAVDVAGARPLFERLVVGNFRSRWKESLSAERYEKERQQWATFWDKGVAQNALAFKRGTVAFDGGKQSALVYRIESNLCRTKDAERWVNGKPDVYRSFPPQHYLAEAERYAHSVPNLPAHILVPLKGRPLYGPHEIFYYERHAFTFMPPSPQLSVQSVKPVSEGPHETASIQTCVIKYVPSNRVK